MRNRPFLYLSILALILVSSGTANAAGKCKVKIDKDGTLVVSAKDIVGTPQWGTTEGEETSDFVDPGGCLTGDKVKKCLIAAPGSLAAKTPPEECTIYVADDGLDSCSTWIKGCTPGVRAVVSQGHTGAMYRWAVFSSYNQTGGWYAGNNADPFGGVNPSNWGDGNGVAGSMSADKEVLRTLFTRKGYAGDNATVVADEWLSYSSTNSKHAAVLFRVKNTTENAIVWTLETYQTAYSGWGERASVAVNGVDTWNSGGFNLNASNTESHVLSIPSGQTSTIIVISASTAPSGASRGVLLAFINDSLALPAGLEYADDLDTAAGGWDQ